MFDLNGQQNVCRICFDKETRLTDIFSTMKMDLIPLNEMLKFCTNIEVRIFVLFFLFLIKNQTKLLFLSLIKNKTKLFLFFSSNPMPEFQQQFVMNVFSICQFLTNLRRKYFKVKKS